MCSRGRILPLVCVESIATRPTAPAAIPMPMALSVASISIRFVGFYSIYIFGNVMESSHLRCVCCCVAVVLLLVAAGVASRECLATSPTHLPHYIKHIAQQRAMRYGVLSVHIFSILI